MLCGRGILCAVFVDVVLSPARLGVGVKVAVEQCDLDLDGLIVEVE